MPVVLVESTVLALVSSFTRVLIGFGHCREGSSLICIRTYLIGIIRGVKLVNLGFLSGSSSFFPVVCLPLCVSFLSQLLFVPSSLFLFAFISFTSTASSAFMYFWALRSNFAIVFGGLLVIEKKKSPGSNLAWKGSLEPSYDSNCGRQNFGGRGRFSTSVVKASALQNLCVEATAHSVTVGPYKLDMQVGDIIQHANFVVFDKEADKLFKVLDTKLSNVEEKDVDGDNVIPNSINALLENLHLPSEIYCIQFLCLQPKLYGKEPNSPHKIAVKCCEDLKNYSQHIDKLIEKQTSKELENNRSRLKTSIECARWLAFQACAFRGHDESLDSKNRGNFIELIKFTSTFNDKVASVILENAPGNAKYTSPTIQKEILHILASNVRNANREEIGDAKFCILVDEARDESKREQMAIILRFVDKEGFIKECFFHVVHVRDTTALTLKNEICAVLSRYNLHIENIRGQGYDGASNMRGEWNGLQALFLKDCPYAYYVHCMAHRLQLALVTASREVKDVYQFFDHLVNIINIVVGSSKRNDELQHAQAEQVENMIASNEIKTGRGANQIGTLQRAGDTRWGSHFQSICSLIKMFDATCKVINTISEEGANYKQRSDAEGAYQLRDDGWEPLLASVISFCEQHEIDIPDMNARYTKGRGRYRRQDNNLTMEHHFRIGIFIVAIDFQLQELKSRFCELTTELVILSSTLNRNDAFRLFKIVDICNLVKKYYPQDFTEHEQELLESQLQHYELDVIKHPDFQNMSTISELCKGLKISGKSKIYFLIDRLIHLVLTLPVSTATTERAFSTTKLLKTRLRNRMKDELLADNMIVYIEKEIAGNFTIEMIMDEFYSMKNRRQA
ncbi:uncharacterized protein LOC126692642 [Quercus robur]|uniref:uncharacterized protein LOC126692642 n=1 Tax=Quercus robur TaxID=38942 RepID=UPI0021614737|nr:uncharacterized protein LOC126692642 [Quercus robur]